MLITHPQHILVLDSGLGGLSVLHAIVQHLPQVACSYLADNVMMPYGTKSEPQLQQRLTQLLEPLLNQYHFDAVVIACNTASTTALHYLRDRFPQQAFVGVVPAIKTAACLSQTGHFGVLATATTLEQTYTQQLIEQFAKHCAVYPIAAPELVLMAEQKLQALAPINLSKLQEIIQPLLKPSASESIDCCVLGCTHFPWLRAELEQLAPQIHWLDSGAAVALQVGRVLSSTTASAARTTVTQHPTPCFFYTGPDYTQTLVDLLNRYGIDHTERL